MKRRGYRIYCEISSQMAVKLAIMDGEPPFIHQEDSW
jgi:hypothetical protein